jgi:uncharacterized protein YoxC
MYPTDTKSINGELRLLRVDVNDLIECTRVQGDRIKQYEDLYDDIGDVDERIDGLNKHADLLTKKINQLVGTSNSQADKLVECETLTEKVNQLISIVNGHNTLLAGLARSSSDKPAATKPAVKKAVKKPATKRTATKKAPRRRGKKA